MPRIATGTTARKINARTGKPYWVARWKDVDRKVKEKMCPSKTAALEYAMRMTLEVAQQKAASAPPSQAEKLAEQETFLRGQYKYLNDSWHILDVIDEYEAACERGMDGNEPLKATTLKGYKKHNKWLRKAFAPDKLAWPRDAGLPLRDGLIDAANAGKYSRRTAKTKYSHLKRIIGFGMRHGYIKEDPTAGLEIYLATSKEKQRIAAVKREKVFRPEEIKAMVAAADALCTEAPDIRSRRSWLTTYRPMLHVLIATGARISEVRALTRSSIDTTKNRIHISQAADHEGGIDSPKSANGVRAVPVSAEVIDYVTYALSRHQFDLVFASANGTPRADNMLRKNFLAPLCKKAGVPNRGFHAFRHYYASAHIAANTPPLQLSKWLGHHSAAFTMATYAHLFDEANEPNLVDLIPA